MLQLVKFAGSKNLLQKIILLYTLAAYSKAEVCVYMKSSEEQRVYHVKNESIQVERVFEPDVPLWQLIAEWLVQQADGDEKSDK